MWLIDLENPPPRLRGTLSRWGVEIRAGLYVGGGSVKLRDALWEHVVSLSHYDTSAIMVCDDTGPQGFSIRTHGPNRREVVDVDGLSLVRFEPMVSDAAEPADVDAAAMEFDPWSWDDVDAEYLEP
jgi:CRISPR-associated protein Cas2